MVDCRKCQRFSACYFDGDDCIGFVPKTMTHADRIRAMSDEELAKWFCSMCNFGDFCPYQDDCDTNGSGILKWMKEEVKDDIQQI